VARISVLARDRPALLLLFCVFSFVYAYFFQGGGWNQNSHFDVIRALVERHTTEITALARNTGDVGVLGKRLYSNKGPGLAFCGAPFYYALYQVERRLGVETGSFWCVNANAQILTFLTSGLPGALLVLVLYCQFRRQHATVGESLSLAGAFGAGSLVLPYSGVMMSHVLTACLLFAAWHLVGGVPARCRTLLLAGVLAGLAVMTDALAAPAAGLFLVYAARRHPRRGLLGFLAGAALMASAYLTYNYLCFGSIAITNQTLPAPGFQSEGLLLGVLQWPQPIRLYWLTVHPFRGLFCCCPVLLIALLSWRRGVGLREMTLERAIPLLVIAGFVGFNLSFNGWTGGWAVGPRYLIPMLPFLFSFALAGFRRFPLLSGVLMGASAVQMLAVAAVLLMVPAPNGGSPPLSSPVADCIRLLAQGQVSVSVQGMLDRLPVQAANARWDSYNLGELVGLRGPVSVLPAVFALTVLAWLGWRLRIAEATATELPAGERQTPMGPVP
jgi:hypothetical protein